MQLLQEIQCDHISLYLDTDISGSLVPDDFNIPNVQILTSTNQLRQNEDILCNTTLNEGDEEEEEQTWFCLSSAFSFYWVDCWTNNSNDQTTFAQEYECITGKQKEYMKSQKFGLLNNTPLSKFRGSPKKLPNFPEAAPDYMVMTDPESNFLMHLRKDYNSSQVIQFIQQETLKMQDRMKAQVCLNRIERNMEMPWNFAPKQPTDYQCYRQVVEAFGEKCVPLQEQLLGILSQIVSLCEAFETADILEQISSLEGQNGSGRDPNFPNIPGFPPIIPPGGAPQSGLN